MEYTSKEGHLWTIAENQLRKKKQLQNRKMHAPKLKVQID
jgi:hypothetical protein